MACPDIENLCHSTGNIFLSGHDLETSVALLVIVLELTAASLKLAIDFLPALLGRVIALESVRAICDCVSSLAVAPTPSPPLALRI
jgi:hypothetical protein